MERLVSRAAVTFVCFFAVTCRCGPLHYVQEFTALNDRPIIGIAAQETPPNSTYGDTYIPATYVKYLQSAGARVVPVLAGYPESYYTDLFGKINGLLFPGGGVSLTNSQYARTGRIFYNFTLQAAANGDLFPLWGTCLGFQLLNTITAGKNLLQDTDADNLTLPLEFSPDYRNSRMLSVGSLPDDVHQYLAKEPVTQNEHQHGMWLEVFTKHKELYNFYHVLSTNVDRKGKRFVSTFEAFNYPIYGVQWHPEKNPFNWNPHYVINHDEHAVRVSQHFANFFVGEARKSSHRFASADEEARYLIDNYIPVYFPDGTFFENYYFNFTKAAW